MSFLAELIIDGIKRPVLTTNINFKVELASNCQPSSLPQGGLIQVEMNGIHNDLFEWMVAPDMMKNGEIRYQPKDGMGRGETMEFWDCYLIHLSLIQSGTTPRTKMILSPGVIRYRGEVTEKEWRITDLSKAGSSASVINYNELQENPKLIESHLEDEEGNVIKKVKRGQTVYLTVKTKDMVGKKINVDLSDSKVDFEHGGNILENDLLENFSVTADTMKIELKTIKRK